MTFGRQSKVKHGGSLFPFSGFCACYYVLVPWTFSGFNQSTQRGFYPLLVGDPQIQPILIGPSGLSEIGKLKWPNDVLLNLKKLAGNYWFESRRTRLARMQALLSVSVSNIELAYLASMNWPNAKISSDFSVTSTINQHRNRKWILSIGLN